MFGVLVPYFQIRIFGVMVVCAIVVGKFLAHKRAAQLGLERESTASAITWALIGGFMFTHFFDVAAYRTSEWTAQPWMIIDPRRGWSLSSFGGFFGAMLAIIIWAHTYKKRPLPYADSLAFGVVPAFVSGRLGCFFVHDHIGRLSTSYLAVAFPGGPRHDLGLDEAIVLAVLSAVFFLLYRHPRRAGVYLALACVWYGLSRFLLDSLRAEDVPGAEPRYLGLTPGQYSGMFVATAGVWLAFTLWRTERSSRTHARDT